MELKLPYTLEGSGNLGVVKLYDSHYIYLEIINKIYVWKTGEEHTFT